MKMEARQRFVLVLILIFFTAWLQAQTPLILVQLTNSWRYNQTVSYDGTNWTAPSFDDSALPMGRGVLGNDDNSAFVQARTNTVLTIGRNTYYFRTRFNFTNSPLGVSLTFSNVVDDGAVYYLNGVEIARLFMTNNTTPVTYATLASNHEATAFDVFTVSGPRVATNLVMGTNVLAVEVHQTSAGSTDIAWGCSLSATFTEVTPAPLLLPVVPPVFGYSQVNAFPGLNFGAPVAIASPPGETNRLFVVNKSGIIYVITNLASPTMSTFMNISGKVFNSGESGLLGLAFHPGYATNRFFFVTYSTMTMSIFGTNAIHERHVRFETSPSNPNAALTNTEIVLINQVDPRDNHNGGDLHFGPDGLLYISLGDGGVQNDGSRNSQTITQDFFSAIMRLDVDDPPRPTSLMPNPHVSNTNVPGNTLNYRIPFDNPFIGRTQFDGIPIVSNRIRTEFYAVGFRNPWRIHFDPATGILYCADVGQNTWEEVDIVIKGGNYGWAYREGLHNGFRAGTPMEPLIDPIQEYQHGSGTFQGNSITGGIVYRGSRFGQLTGWYVFADYTSGNIWRLRYDGTNTVPFQRIAGLVGLSAFGADPSNGDVLMANVNAGTVHRLVYDTNSVSVPIPPTLAQTGAFTNLTTLTNQTQALGASTGLVPYDINVPFWSDNAHKSRWFLSSTNLKVRFRPEGNWSFTNGQTWVKHFDLELTNGVVSSSRRIETRFLVKNSNGVYGITYRWGNSLTNATLVPDDGFDEDFVINDGGTIRTQTWHYPSRTECNACHSPVAGFALGFNTVQMNRDFGYAGGVSNQIAFMHAAGIFSNAVTELNSLRALAAATNETSSLEWRVRSYLAANCAHCHQPGGSALGFWNANITNFTINAGLINGVLNNDGGNPNARVIVPGSASNSMLLSRISVRGPGQMPPLASSVLDTQAITLVSRWVTNELAGGWTNTIEPLNIHLAATNGNAAVQFIHPPNRAYRVETATNLTSPIQWRFLDVPANRPTYPASSNAVSETDPTNTTQKFYRVRVSTP